MMPNAKPLPSLDFLENTFQLSNESSSNLIWIKPTCTKLKPGSMAGCLRKNLYWYVSFDKKQYLVHRIVYFMYHKINIDHIQIDHINQNKFDNSIFNLRIATHSQQQCNKTAKKNSTSNHKGVSWHPPLSKWRASICVNKKRMHIGYYATELQAAVAYNTAAEKHHLNFAYLNNV